MAQERRSTGEERFANLSREYPKILICTLKSGLSWRFSPPLSILRAMVTPRMAAAHCSFPSCSCCGFQEKSCRGSFSPRQELRAVGNPLLQLSSLPRPDGGLGAGKGWFQPCAHGRDSLRKKHQFRCLQDMGQSARRSPHAEDRSQAPTGASASPWLAQYVWWWVSANKGPQEHPLKRSQPNTHLALPLQVPAVIRHTHHKSTQICPF